MKKTGGESESPRQDFHFPTGPIFQGSLTTLLPGDDVVDRPYLRPLRPASDDGAEFLDQADPTLESLGGIAQFESEAGHGTKGRRRIPFAHVIE